MKTFFIYFCELFAFPIVDLFTKQIEGKENIPSEDNFILASNHLNSLDYWFIGNVLKKRLRTLRFVGAMEDFITLLHSGFLYYAAETITINRKKQGRDIILEKIIGNLRNKKSIVLFPEGDTNREKKLLRGRSGIAELTLRTGVPVIPFGMKKAKNNFKRIIEIGKPLYFSEEQELLKKIENNQEKHYMLLRTVTNRIMKKTSKLSQKHYYYDN